MRKNWHHILNTIFPIGLLAFLAVLFSMMGKKEISTSEKRKLAAFPALNWQTWTDGSFTRTLEDYIADHFVYREDIIAGTDGIKNAFGIARKSNEGKFIAIKKKKAAIKTKKTTLVIDSNYTVAIDTGAELLLTNGVFIYDSCSYQFFGGNSYSSARYANMYNAVVEHLPKHIKYYAVLVPSSTEFNLPPSTYRYKANSETKGIHYIYSGLNEKIGKADVYNHMKAHRKEYLFFKTDHHWTARGAYYAYEAFCEIADISPLTLGQMPSKFVGGPFLGSLYQLTHDPTLKANPDRLEIFDIPFNGAKAFYKFDANQTQWTPTKIVYKNGEFGIGYGVFLGLDYPVMRIDGPQKNGRRLFILKESYANAFVPFLVPHFEQIFVADVRYFPYKIDKFIEEYNINEFLMMNQLVMANNPYTPQKVLNMLKGKQ